MNRGMKPFAAVAAVVMALLAGSSAHALRLPGARHCPVFPATNPWNQRVDGLPVASDSAQLIASIGLDSPVHADFGSGTWDGGPIGIPFDVVTRNSCTESRGTGSAELKPCPEVAPFWPERGF